MKVIIVGGGEVGKALINLLSGEKHKVTLIEQDEALVNDIANETDILVIKGDATQMSFLKDAGIEKADAIVAVTNDDKTNLMVSQIAASSKVPRVISRVNIPGNEELFAKIGITKLVPSVGLVVSSIRNALEDDESKKRLIAELGRGDVELMEVQVSEKSSLVGKKVSELPKARICTIFRNAELVIPTEKEVIKAEDVLVFAAKAKDAGKLIKLLEPKG